MPERASAAYDRRQAAEWLLRLIADTPLPTPYNSEAVPWRDVLTVADEHRVMPMLHWQVTRRHTGVVVPPSVASSLSDAFRASAARALGIVAELHRLDEVLNAAGISYVLLKGPRLTYSAYPHPALRPMRDVDVLVPAAHAVRAFELLQHAGFTRFPQYAGDPTASLASSHHLPPLGSARMPLSIEVHHRLFGVDDLNALGSPAPDPAHCPELWEPRTMANVGGRQLPVEPSELLLLHLTIHAVTHHWFDNGPLVLSDIGHLLRTQRMDWQAFWKLTRRFGAERVAVLCLTLAHDFGWLDALPSMPSETDARVLLAARTLLLRSMDVRGDVGVAAALTMPTTFRGRIAEIRRRAWPSPTIMRSRSAIDSHGELLVAYLRHLARIATTRLPAILGTTRDQAHTPEVDALHRLQRWVQGR